MQPINLIADIIGILGAVFALFAWLQTLSIQKKMKQEQLRQHRKVTVVLQNGATQLELPVEILRAELTRSEVLGCIGMIPMKEKSKRFSLDYLGTSQFFRQINDAVQGHGDVLLTIPCTEEEFAQFDLSRYQS